MGRRSSRRIVSKTLARDSSAPKLVRRPARGSVLGGGHGAGPFVLGAAVGLTSNGFDRSQRCGRSEGPQTGFGALVCSRCAAAGYARCPGAAIDALRVMMASNVIPPNVVSVHSSVRSPGGPDANMLTCGAGALEDASETPVAKGRVLMIWGAVLGGPCCAPGGVLGGVWVLVARCCCATSAIVRSRLLKHESQYNSGCRLMLCGFRMRPAGLLYCCWPVEPSTGW